MSLVDKIKELSNANKISIAELERKIGISNGQIRKWDTSTPGIDKLELVADYFNVSVDYLLGREEKTSLAEKYGVFAFDGEPVTDEEVEFLKSVLAAKRATDKK